MFVLLIKASLVLTVLLAFYKLVLEKESFFSANRAYLILCLVFAFALPLVVAPKIIENQGVVDDLISSRIEPATQTVNNNDRKLEGDLPVQTTQDLTFDLNSEKKLHVGNVDDILLDSNNSIQEGKEVKKGNSIYFWLKWIYIFGVVVLSINLIAQVITVMWRIYRTKDKIEDDDYIIVNLAGEVEPCSFFKYIFINPELYDFDSYEQIIQHEKVHASKWHSFDILFAELSVVVLWFNPLVWLLRKELEKNIEYQTDFEVLKDNKDEKENYQMNLVKIACQTSPMVVTTNYNQSLIKQRILKMNSKRSNSFSYWKYVFSLPMILGLVLILNRPLEINAQETISSVTSANESTLEEIQSLNSDDNLNYNPVDDTNQKNSKVSEKEDHKGSKGDVTKKPEINTPNSEVDPIKKSKSINEDNSVCDKLIDAVRLEDHNNTRWILLNDNLDCMVDDMGMPSRNVPLIKGLLEYGAHLNILHGQQVEIEDITFIIDVATYDGQGCKDQNYQELVEAIRNNEKWKCEQLLSTRTFTCPLNSNGVKNDFPFIKEMLAHGALTKIENKSVLSIYGVKVIMDVIDFDMLTTYDGQPKKGRKFYDLKKDDNPDSTPCIDLMQIIQQGDVERCRKMLVDLDPNCFHKKTHTITTDGITSSTSEIQTPLLEAIKYDHLEIAKMIIEDGASIESGDGDVTPLMIAVFMNKPEMVELLLVEGANVAKKDSGGWKAMDYALDLKNQKIIDLLEFHSK